MIDPIVNDPRVRDAATAQPYPSLFVTISGAHLYGFASPDSDVDLRGIHVLPIPMITRLTTSDETIDRSWVRAGLEIDLVTHDLHKFCTMLLTRNGYVLEQLYSPLIVRTTPEHAELQALAVGCITKYHAHHYLGFARNRWAMFEREEQRRVKTLLYVFRVLLTGIHLMQTGTIEANLLRLNEEFKLTYLDELIERKQTGDEKAHLDTTTEMGFFQQEVERLLAEVERARDESRLPPAPQNRPEIDDFLVRVRMGMGVPN